MARVALLVCHAHASVDFVGSVIKTFAIEGGAL